MGLWRRINCVIKLPETNVTVTAQSFRRAMASFEQALKDLGSIIMSVYDDYEWQLYWMVTSSYTKTKLRSLADNDAKDAEPNTKTHQIDLVCWDAAILNKHAARFSWLWPADWCTLADSIESIILSRFTKGAIRTSHRCIIRLFWLICRCAAGRWFFGNVRIGHAHGVDAENWHITTAIRWLILTALARRWLRLFRARYTFIEEAKACSRNFKLGWFMRVTSMVTLYYGNMRFDVIISAKYATELGKRAEIKNPNSFRSVERAPSMNSTPSRYFGTWRRS